MKAPKRTNVSADVEAQAEAVRLQPVDSASMVVRPSTVATTYVEVEYEALAAEQEPLWEAEGLLASRSSVIVRDSSKLAAKEARRQLKAQQSVVAEARRAFQHCRTVLHPFRRREPGAKKWYLARWACLLGGDVAGQAGAALSFGEPYVTAIPQALATGMAALTAGMVGAELRDLRNAVRRQRDPDDLPEALAPWAYMFRVPDMGSALAKLIVGVGAVASLTIAGGIFWLRAAIEGSSAGGVYGLLAIGIALASAINAYFYADEIADQIDSTEQDYTRELKRADQIAAHPHLVRHASARAEAGSIRGEHTSRGLAAAHRLRALRARVLRLNPGVVGHGIGPDEQTPIGRRVRGGDQS